MTRNIDDFPSTEWSAFTGAYKSGPGPSRVSRVRTPGEVAHRSSVDACSTPALSVYDFTAHHRFGPSREQGEALATSE